MNYTDKEILDLEKSLDGVGLSEITSFGICIPESPDSKSILSEMESRYGRKLHLMGIECSSKNLIQFKSGEKGSLLPLFILKGLRAMTYSQAEKIAEEIGAEQIYEFAE